VVDHEARLINAEGAITTLSTTKADKTELTNGLNGKVDKDTYTADKATFALKTEVDAALAGKVDTGTYNGKIQEIEGSITTLTNNKANKTDVSNALNEKLDKSTYAADKPTFALKTDLSGKVDVGTYNGKIQEIEGSITTLTNNKADKSELTNGLNGKVDKSTYAEDKKTFALKSELAGKVDTGTYNGKIQEIEGSITTLTNTKADKSELTGKVDKSTYTEDKKTFALKGDVEAALSGKVDTNVYSGKIQEIEGSITTLGNTKADQSTVDALEANLTTKINDDIRTANALVYKATVEKKADLPSLPADLENAESIPEIRIGDMYVISKADVDNDVAPGDLFIAQGEENEETGLIEKNLVWSHVKTGYDA
jgi:hypothetical protein